MPIFSNFVFILLINMFMHLWHLESIDQVDIPPQRESSHAMWTYEIPVPILPSALNAS